MISAPSGAGRDNSGQLLIERVPDLYFSISYTTRPARDGEKGVDYYFVTESAFQRWSQRSSWNGRSYMVITTELQANVRIF